MSRNAEKNSLRPAMIYGLVMCFVWVWIAGLGGCEWPPKTEKGKKAAPVPEPPMPSPVEPHAIPTGNLIQAMYTCRNWITFAPPEPFNPNNNAFPSEEQLERALLRLYLEGWRGLVTYSMDGTLSQVPWLAKKVGFTMVVAGIFWWDLAQLERERTAVLGQLQYIDGLVVGSEGLHFGRYTRTQLEAEIASLRTVTRLPIATTEPLNMYLSDPSLCNVGDWVFPNVHPYWAGIRNVTDAVVWTASQYTALVTIANGQTVICHESWWPTGGDPACNEENQVEYFRQLSATTVRFIWGEAFNMRWKNEGTQGPYWGLHTSTQLAKLIIAALQSIYIEPYPQTECTRYEY